MAFNIYSSSSGPLSFYFSFLWSDFFESCHFRSGSNLIVGSSFHSGLVCSFCIGQFITKANFFPLQLLVIFPLPSVLWQQWNSLKTSMCGLKSELRLLRVSRCFAFCFFKARCFDF